jgi:hypothetical protein
VTEETFPSRAQEEIDALLACSAPRRSYGGLIAGVCCTLVGVAGGYLFSDLLYAPPRPALSSFVARASFDSLTQYTTQLHEQLSELRVRTNTFDAAYSTINEVQTKTVNLEARLTELSTQIPEVPSALFELTYTKDDGMCIITKIFDYDPAKQLYSNGKNILLCRSVHP